MTEEAKILLGELRTEGCKRCIHMKIGLCAHIQQGKTCGTLYHQAADLIEALSAELEQVKRERDAAVWDITNSAPCFACKHFYRNSGTCHGGMICYSHAMLFEMAGKEYDGQRWEWRGPCEENGGEKNESISE